MKFFEIDPAGDKFQVVEVNFGPVFFYPKEEDDDMTHLIKLQFFLKRKHKRPTQDN